ncbi:MAG: DEAD/DEAH box helicase family protein [Alphaproteobacteria bacterium]|nr:DEAD/DEAH box helicase family protein [Alphaproteobacteria bacterium]
MKNLHFKGKFRSYQQKVLDNLNAHLKDNKLHIVAAPGAGKTTLGIEVIARLKRPVLIFAPTLTIRNQWKERIIEAFLDDPDQDIISLDIKNPKQITITTYQSLWSVFSNKKEVEEDWDEDTPSAGKIVTSLANEIVGKLKKQKTSLLCFDEAHHLRNEWWKALDVLMDKLKPKQTLALTATPPYDVTYNEWKRYEQLCGPIDDLISIPELVKNGDLCPHQDFVYFSNLRQNESQKIQEFEDKVHLFMDYLMNETVLGSHFLKLDIFDNPQKYIEQIYDNPDFFISIASYLHATNQMIPLPFLKLFDMSEKDLPAFDEGWAETFLNGLFYAYRSFLAPLEKDIKDLETKAHKSSIIFRKKVCISSNPSLQKGVASSVGKLDSIVDIVNAEFNHLKKDLRMVILADYIREDMTAEIANSLGVVPIFLKLSEKYPKISMAILTGTLITVPKDKKEFVLKQLEKEKLHVADLKFTPFKHNTDYFKITFSVSAKSKIVKIITELFNQGIFNIVIGTQALLGEGWDAPSINSLILSSTISSYVLSNQMRGRAIRKDKNNPEKISNIWHLASFKKLNLWDINAYKQSGLSHLTDDYGYDLKQIERRFQGYEAPTVQAPYQIQNGLERLNLDLVTEKNIEALNQNTLELSAHRDTIKESWKKSLYVGGLNARMHVGMSTPSHYKKTFTYKGSFTFLMAFYAGISFELYSILNRIIPMYSAPVTGAFVLYFMGRPLFKFIRNGSVVGSIKSIIQIIMDTLSHTGDIQTPLRSASVLVQKQKKGEVFCSVEGLLPAELNLVLKSLQEFLDPIENPRYILERRGTFGQFFENHPTLTKFIPALKQKDYHAIPSVIAAQKKNVLYFKKQWEKKIGRCQLIYTRSEEGRQLMLKTRKYAFSNEARQKTFSSNKWS